MLKYHHKKLDISDRHATKLERTATEVWLRC